MLIFSHIKFITDKELLIQFVKKEKEGRQIVWWGKQMRSHYIEELDTKWMGKNGMNRKWRNSKFRGLPFGTWIQVNNYLIKI